LDEILEVNLTKCFLNLLPGDILTKS